MSEDMFDVFRGTVKANYLDDNVIDLIHERYMVLVHIDENARSTIHAALQRAWVEKTLRVPITRQNERLLLQYKRSAEMYTRDTATAARCAAESAMHLIEQKAEYARIQQEHGEKYHCGVLTPLCGHRGACSSVLRAAGALLEKAKHRAASDAATATLTAEKEEKSFMGQFTSHARDIRATEIARIGLMMKIPDWVKEVVIFAHVAYP